MADGINCNVICEEGDIEQFCMVCNMAKTSHGKAWEKPACKMFLDDIGYVGTDKETLFSDWEINSALDHTAPHDISEDLLGVEWNGSCLDGTQIKEKYGNGISVKLMKKGCDVCMGKIERIWNHFGDGPWSMIVGFYEKRKINIDGENVECLCIDKVYYIPFLRGLVDRELVFGNVENWPETLAVLEKKVFEAATYKGGKSGVGGLIDPTLPIKQFHTLTTLYKKRRLSGPCTEESTKEEVLAASIQCHADIMQLKHDLCPRPEKQTIVAGIKLDHKQARTQGRISYGKFLKLVNKIGREITDEQIVIDNGLLHPIKKMNDQEGETKQGGGFVRKKTKKTRKRKKTNKKRKKTKKKRKKRKKH